MLENEISKLLEERPIPVDTIFELIDEAAKEAKPEDFSALIKVGQIDDTFGMFMAIQAFALMPAWGTLGISTLRDFVINGPHATFAIQVLAVIASGNPIRQINLIGLPDNWDNSNHYSVAPELASEAQLQLHSAFLSQLANGDSKSLLLRNLSSLRMLSPDIEAQYKRNEFVFDMLISSRLILNEQIINDFKSLLQAAPEREEELHQFLLTNPILIDPLVTELRNKHELGDDFITDFVVRRINNEYVVIEIENSTDNLFNQDGTFSSHLTQATSQVRDFQAWISDNLAYAQTKLPGIRHPEGLVVIGRREGLNENNEKRLDEENYSRRGHIKILTFDDLLLQAQAIYKNILEMPIILHSRDQKSL